MIDDIAGPIVITGASGFIGSNLVRRMAESRSDIHAFIRSGSDLWRLADLLPKITVHSIDLTDRRDVFDRIRIIKPKTVFHAAAHGVHSFQKDSDKIGAVNLRGTKNILDASIKSGFEIFINTGSSSEYGLKNEPMKETDSLEPRSPYAISKAAATAYCQNMSSLMKLPIITLRPFSVYGPYEAPTKFIPTLLNALLGNTCPPLASPGIARDYIFIDDLVDAYLTASLRPDLGGEIFNIGSGKQTTLKEVVELAIRLTGADIKPKWGTMKPGEWDATVWQADISKAKSMLRWRPKNTLEEGLIKTINWMKK
ncbi:MAG: NAD-dependent epimerase/dehydratase family protein [Patescibacteria group bacterium]|nr:NAD-dependent epimerase/dehydratase family protein [Patescibacteria group bacterium]